MVLANLPQSAESSRENINEHYLEIDRGELERSFRMYFPAGGSQVLDDAGPTPRNTPLFRLIVQQEGLATKET